MGRIIKLSLAVLLTIGGTGVALSNSPNDYVFSDIPSSGFLQPVPSNADVAGASLGFNRMPDGGFGPSTATLEDLDDLDVVAEPRAVLKFKDRLVVRLWDWCASAPAAKPCTKGPSVRNRYGYLWGYEVEIWIRS